MFTLRWVAIGVLCLVCAVLFVAAMRESKRVEEESKDKDSDLHSGD